MRYEVVKFVNLVGRLVSTFNHDPSALRYDQLSDVQTFCWLNVDKIAFINRIAFIEWNTTHL